MATVSYPKISSNTWQRMRARAVTAPSARFTSTLIASQLDMATPKSALDNVILPLRRLGLIDEEGALTERGAKWRVDAAYADACQEILDEVYPTELTSLTDGSGRPAKSQIYSWFQHQGFGESNARQMAATYVLIAEKKLPEANATEPKKKAAKAPAKIGKPKKTAAIVTTESVEEPILEPAELPLPNSEPVKSGPNVHLDIQIHIPATASPEQIDQIFASMAKHLYQ